MASETAVVDLSQPAGVRLLAGKQLGAEARRRYGLDALDDGDRPVLVRIPVPSVASSFIRGMFAESIERLGAEGFSFKYRFEASLPVLANILDNVRIMAEEKGR